MERFDYIVAGSGSAGAVLASKLSEDPGISVLLLEQGPPDQGFYIDLPVGFSALVAKSDLLSRYVSTKPGTTDEEVWYAGRTLGGSSSVNGLIWSRCQVEDYDRLAELGNKGWSWAELLPYFISLERYVDIEVDPSLHGVDGPIEITSNPDRYNRRLTSAFIGAGEALGLPRRRNMNGVDQEGIGFSQRSIDRRGRRVSAAKAFLHPAKSRRNLCILTGVTVDKVLVRDGRAVGVAARRGGNPVEYEARREVIVSCGAMASPMVLQRSGIGPGAHLAAQGVDVLVDSPGVGHNLRDKRHLFFQYTLKDSTQSHNRRYAGPAAILHMLQYVLGLGGPMTETLLALAYARTRPGTDRPDAELMLMGTTQEMGPSGKPVLQKTAGFSILGYSLRPTTTGSILLASKDPERQGTISFDPLSTDHDRADAVSLTRYLRRLTQQPIWEPLLEGEQAATAWAQTDDEIIQLFRQQSLPGAHVVGTCAMGHDERAVVDDRLRVRGLEGLRVVDLSVLPEMLSGHTSAPAMAMALRAADMIRQDDAA